VRFEEQNKTGERKSPPRPNDDGTRGQTQKLTPRKFPRGPSAMRWDDSDLRVLPPLLRRTPRQDRSVEPARMWANVSRHWGAMPSAINMRLFVELCLIGLIAS
jgi:hypothetical protein